MKAAILAIAIACLIAASTNIIILGIDFILIGEGLHPVLAITCLLVSFLGGKWLVEELKESVRANYPQS